MQQCAAEHILGIICGAADREVARRVVVVGVGCGEVEGRVREDDVGVVCDGVL